jgi:NADH-quinone oxidoreductase subunit K
MPPVPIEHALLVAGILFLLGVVGMLVRRDVFVILLSLEIMLNAAGLAFIIAGARWGQPDGQVMFVFILAVAAAEVAVGLGILMQFHPLFRSVDADEARKLRG